MTDIRDRPHLGHGDIAELNFIRSESPFVFRRHFRNGMRSQIMEVLRPGDVQRETTGMTGDGVRWFPKAEPRFMLRLFRRRFSSLDQALEEIRRLRIIEAYLAPDQLARSSEFIVAYRHGGRYDPLLCGLQVYAPGQALDPWQLLTPAQMARWFESAQAPGDGGIDAERFAHRFCINAGRFVDGVRRMISEAGFIPDLAGTRNMVVTRDGNIRLVDINNVSRIDFGDAIPVDDKGYPVCDKSVEALLRIEGMLPDRSTHADDPLVRHFLDPSRMKAVAVLDRQFHRRLAGSPAGEFGRF
ncbi:MAG: hypothetical protein JEZ11_16380 [Desulfobacterales bacterium]|nr:hypothetical protein [Desulfobacterales bacterium]